MNSFEATNEIANLLNNKKAVDVVLIDISEKSSIADYFVNASTGSERQLRSLADDVEDKFAELGFNTRGKEGLPESGWILIDGGDVIVNLFTRDVREKYSLDKIWGDCKIINFE